MSLKKILVNTNSDQMSGMDNLMSNYFRLLLFDTATDRALGVWSDGNFDDWDGSGGADSVLLRGFESSSSSCEEIPLSCIAMGVRPRVLDGGWDDGEDIPMR